MDCEIGTVSVNALSESVNINKKLIQHFERDDSMFILFCVIAIVYTQ